jgi:hypothetical protein
MINRVIYGGKVSYRVADLAELFEVTTYKMRKAVKNQQLGTILKAFGRCLFVLEENVGKIEINGELTIIETIFEESIEKKMWSSLKQLLLKNQKVKKGRKNPKRKLIKL